MGGECFAYPLALLPRFLEVIADRSDNNYSYRSIDADLGPDLWFQIGARKATSEEPRRRESPQNAKHLKLPRNLSPLIKPLNVRQRLILPILIQIVVTACLRTAFTKGGKGGFKDTQAADLMTGALKGLLERSKIDPALVEDVCVGEVLAPGGGATEMRAAALVAGFPESTAVRTLNRQCSSGLQACVDVANQIRAGMIEVGIGAGVESMSTQYGYVFPAPATFPC